MKTILLPIEVTQIREDLFLHYDFYSKNHLFDIIKVLNYREFVAMERLYTVYKEWFIAVPVERVTLQLDHVLGKIINPESASTSEIAYEICNTIQVVCNEKELEWMKDKIVEHGSDPVTKSNEICEYLHIDKKSNRSVINAILSRYKC